MKKLHYLLLILVLTISTAPGCKKNKTEEQLPPETHVGAFTFGCKVDGKIYTASGKGGGLLSDDHVYYSMVATDSSISIGAGSTSNSKNKFNCFFTIKYIADTGIYLMKTFPYEGKFYDESNGNLPGTSNTFTTTDSYIGKIHIKYFNGSFNPPTFATVIAGTFEMDAVNGEGKVIHITEGRFDIGQ